MKLPGLKTNRIKLTRFVLSLLALSLLNACGSDENQIEEDHGYVSYDVPDYYEDPNSYSDASVDYATYAGTCSEYGDDLSGLTDTAVDVLGGSYSGTLYKEYDDLSVLSQSYTLTLTITQVDDLKLGAIIFRSEGAIGSFNFQSCVDIGYQSYYSNGVLYYTFNTQRFSFDALSQSEMILSIVLGVTANNDTYLISPTQSSVYIKDCDYSLGTLCSNAVAGVWTENFTVE